MAKPILVANWKNYPGSLSEANSLIAQLKKHALFYKKISTFIAPPLPYFSLVSDKTRGFANLASQDIFFRGEGTYTGSVLPNILKSFGVKITIVGHSERRALGESNDIVTEKMKVAIKAGILPLLCIGEKERDEKGDYLEELKEQLKYSLEGLRRKEDAGKILIAYEPVWSVGRKAKGVMSPEDLAQTVIFIKKILSDKFGREAGAKIPILYGGSVDGRNAANLYDSTGIRGFLVGRASLEEENFKEIVSAISK